MVRRVIGLGTAWIILIFVASPAFAQLPAARLMHVFPPGGRVGTTVTVTVTGTDLDGATEMRFSRSGISAKPADDSASGTERKFAVTIQPDAPTGECEARFVGACGISNPRAFVISNRPEAVRNKPGECPRLPIGSAVSARLTTGVVDSYTVDIKAGQRTLFTCLTKEIDSKSALVMVLLDSAAHEVERSRHSGVLDFSSPSDGSYTLQVHDVLYRGGPDYFYRIQATVGPHIDAIFPPAGEPGSKATYTLYGRNLPGGRRSDLRAVDGKPLEQLEEEIELPKEDSTATQLDAAARVGPSGWPVDAFAYRLRSDAGTSNPVLIGLARSPLVAKQQHGDSNAEPGKIEPPIDLVGRFYPHGHRDCVSFDALKGDVYAIEMVSQRLGSPCSPFVLLQRVTRNNKGVEQASDVQEIAGAETNVGGAGFRTSTRDGSFRLDAKEGGTYRLLIRDLFNTSVDNPALTYRLSIRREQPDFRILVLPLESAVANEVPLWAPFLRNGGSLPLRLILSRQDGFNGEVRVDAEGLPADLKCSGATIAAGQNAGILTFSAGEHASRWSGPLRIIARAKANGADLVREARISTVIWPANPTTQELAVSRLAEDFPAAVSGDEPEPISFDVSDKPYEMTSGGKLQIPIKIRRDMKVNAPVKVTPGGLAALSKVPELTLGPDKSEASLTIDLAQQSLSIGSHTFFLQAQAPITYQRRSFPPAGKSAEAKTTPQVLQVTSYSPLITVNVVQKAAAKDK